MAIAYPAMTKEILARGHTLGTHTWSHPMNLARMAPAAARDQIDSGFAAVALAADQPIAPFFRFPGLSDSPALMSYLQERGIAAFTVDVVSNDSYIGDVNRLIARTLEHVETNQAVSFSSTISSTSRRAPCRQSSPSSSTRIQGRAHARQETVQAGRQGACCHARYGAAPRARPWARRQTNPACGHRWHEHAERGSSANGCRDSRRTPKQDAIPVAAIMPLPRDRLAKPGSGRCGQVRAGRKRCRIERRRS